MSEDFEIESDFDRIDGVIHSISIGTDKENKIHYKVSGEPMPQSGLTIKEILLDRAKLAKFGVTHIVITVRDGSNSRIWREVVNDVQIEHDLSRLVDKIKKNGKEKKYEVL